MSVKIEVEVPGKCSLMFLQNRVPLLEHLKVVNDGGESLGRSRLRVVFNPAYVEEMVWELEGVRSHEDYEVPMQKPVYDVGLLDKLLEHSPGTVELTLENEAGETIATSRKMLDWLPRHAWTGRSYHPELLASLVQPNDPAVSRLLREASEIMNKAGLPGQWQGYRSTTAVVMNQIIALWKAVVQWNIMYVLPPQSFISDGQLVRTPSDIMRNREATCLDSAMLFASALAHAGLHPLIAMFDGHALVGCWLKEENWGNPIVTDFAQVCNHLELGEVVFFETTLAVRQRGGDVALFDVARQSAAARFVPQKESSFISVLDVVRAWTSGIQRVKLYEEEVEPVATDGEAQDVSPDEFVRVEDDESEELVSEQKNMTRLDRWQRKLLDLTQRNNLLNMRLTSGTVEIITHSSTELEDMLAQDVAFNVMSFPDTVAQSLIQGQGEVVAEDEMARLQMDFARDIFSKKNLLGLPLKKIRRNGKLLPVDLNTVLLDLYRKSKSSIEESGSTILYLALGLLQWTKKDSRSSSAKSYYAPVILLPIEMTRKNVKSDFSIAIGDDEPRINLTLLEVLRMEYGITIPELEGDLPQDENGLDIDRIYRIFREAIKGMEGWTVQDRCFLSTFTFSKYLMWKDLVSSREALERSHMVKYLLDPGKEEFAAKVEFPDTATLDAELKSSDVYTPLSYDASQLTAVLSAARGKNFVLIGPPGTGKSQTIANMIAQCLAEGKSVLFVAEKVAALSVVYERLKKNNMGEFCLEIHSNKANKKQIIDQLGKTRDMVDRFRPEIWTQESATMEGIKEKLMQVTDSMHREYPNGLTLFSALSCICRGGELPELLPVWEDFPNHSREDLTGMKDAVENMGFYFDAVRKVVGTGMRYVNETEWSVGWERELLSNASALKAACDDSVIAYAELASLLQVRAKVWDKDTREKLNGLMEIAMKSKAGDYAFMVSSTATQSVETLSTAAELVSKYKQSKKMLSLDYPEHVIESAMLPTLLKQWKDADESWLVSRFFKRRAVKKALYSFAGISTKLPICVQSDLENLIKMREYKESISRMDRECRQYETLWKGLDTDEYLALDVYEIHRLVERWKEYWADTPEATVLERVLGYHSGELDSNTPLAKAWDKVLQANKDRELKEKQFFETAKATPQVVNDLEELADDCLSLQEESAYLREWTMWRSAEKKVVDKGIGGIGDALLAGEISVKKVMDTFEVNYCRWWANNVVEREPLLAQFTRRVHDHNVEKFRNQDDVMMDLAQKYLRSVLLSRVTGKFTEEYAILNRELVKQRRHMPLRKLIDSIPNAVRELKPCFLMSPLSIAQYLDADKHSFDVVIFDEASQIPVWDAIGAIARGSSAVVVGDPKQLPPTNFFGKVNDDGDDEEEENLAPDMESILSECMACGLPTIKLKWHYRSRNESLIAFSNRQYYDGDLVTFPSPVTRDNAVSYHKVEGTYDRGKTHTSVEEAKAVVEDIVKTVTAPGFVYNSSTSIGVVTFNIQQQKLIQSLLEEERRKDERVDRVFSEDCEDPIFVKNLESVQGDERGVIYFSMTFGPDKTGAFTMNFGPLNKDGGERRLNVAVTRAKVGMKIFTLMSYDQIDLGRTSSQGVADMKLFLEYAEKGAKVFESLKPMDGGEPTGDESFEASIAAALEERGWKCDTQVGIAGHRIDVGVIDPDKPGNYIAGVEIDGKGYHSSLTVRDRDKLREGVLKGLGWDMLRIWVMDWWRDPNRYADELNTELKKILKRRRDQESGKEASPAPLAETPLLFEPEEVGREDKLPGMPFLEFERKGKKSFGDPMTTEASVVAESLLAIVKGEGPVSYRRLVNIYLAQADIPRATVKIKRALEELTQWLVKHDYIEEDKENGLHDNVDNDLIYREKGTPVVSMRYGEGRSLDEIPVKELQAVAQEMRGFARTFPGTDEHLKAICEYYGLRRLTQPVKDYLRKIIL